MRRFAVGDFVRFNIGKSYRTVRVIEDRGDLGINGEQILRVTDADHSEFEIPAGSATLVKGGEPMNAGIEFVVSYLGGDFPWKVEVTLKSGQKCVACSSRSDIAIRECARTALHHLWKEEFGSPLPEEVLG
jgi:hypothetical protein